MRKNEEFILVGQLLPDGRTLSLFGSVHLPYHLSPLIGHELEVAVTKLRHAKSAQQTRYWFGVVIKAFQEFVFENEGIWLEKHQAYVWVMQNILHEQARKQVILGQEIITLQRPHWSAFKVDEASNAIEQTIAWLAEHGKEVPPPGRTWTISDY